MKEKFLKFIVDTDVTAIECDFNCANVTFSEAPDGNFVVEYPNAKNISVASGGNSIIISQAKRSLFKFRKQDIKIYVPNHTVPSVRLSGKNYSACVSGGIYGDFYVTAESGAVNLDGCSFKSAEIVGGDIDAHLSDATVKGNLSVYLERGNILAENTFALYFECRVTRGNMGLVNLNCKDSAFDTLKGNISASLKGDAENYNIDLIVGEGTANRESSQSAAENSFHAYTKKGNVVLDFVGSDSAKAEIEEITTEQTENV